MLDLWIYGELLFTISTGGCYLKVDETRCSRTTSLIQNILGCIEREVDERRQNGGEKWRGRYNWEDEGCGRNIGKNDEHTGKTNQRVTQIYIKKHDVLSFTIYVL